MKIFVGILYIFYKVSVIFLLWFGWQKLALRVELATWLVYGFFSFFALLYFFISVVIKKLSLFSRWTVWWLVVFEWLAVCMVGMYQTVFREASLVRVAWLVASLAPLHLLFFDIFRVVVSRWNMQYLSNLQKPSWFFEYSLEFPFVFSLMFLGWEGLIQPSRMLLVWVAGLFGWLLVRHWYIGWLWQRGMKRFSRWLAKQNPLMFSQVPPFHDTNMLSPLVFAWKQYAARVRSLQKDILWALPVLSEDLQKKIVSDSDLRFGKEKPATVAAIRWETRNLTVLQEYVFLDVFSKVVGEYVSQYDGFPFWEHQTVYVFFGFPFFYEQKNLLAIEFCQRLLSEIQLISQEQGISIEASSLVLAGTARIGAVPIPGKDFLMLFPQGEVFGKIEQIARASAGLKIPLLIDKQVLEGLEARFFVQKTYKLTLGNETIVLCQVVD
ncbi:hypothetical protein [Thermospira aquatica]|uniref:Guanylate cyclase domain-containing protein n=1 Tax=Thermospira aquatica TaxID=2828656 RepID=A0AAX3BGD3_9SPIR|nr:hypothetical protein [Thermospira aquatica]URA11079.1 hypothetical protein KDW03_04580 [Thermospira aquatica]